MALHTKKMYYRRGGVTYPVDLFTTIAEVGTAYKVFRDGTTNVFAPIVVAGNGYASHVAVRHAGATKYIGRSRPGTWHWAVGVTNTGYNIINGIAVDSAGNVYVTGEFSGTITFGSTTLTSAGGYDIFVAKLNTNGAWQWAVRAGGTSNCYGYSVAVDASANVYITGSFSGTATFGATNHTSAGLGDIFVAKLNTSGAWQWAVKFGGTGFDLAYSIAVGTTGNVYLSGLFNGTVNFGGTNLTSAGQADVFVLKLNTSGTRQWVVKAGGGGYDFGTAVALDASENVYVAGSFTGTAAFGATNLTSSSSSQDVFVAKLNTSGTWQWAVKAGGTGFDDGKGLAVDTSGNVYVTGSFSGTATFGSTNLISGGAEDIFVAKLNTSGAWQWAVKAGGTVSEFPNSIAVDSDGNCYVVGWLTAGTIYFGSITLTTSGSDDAYLAKLSSAGTWEWVVKANGADLDRGLAVAVGPNKQIYWAGRYLGSTVFGPTTLTSTTTCGFVAKVS